MKTVYQCDFCDGAFATPRRAQRHEVECDDNPDNRTCNTCRHLLLDGREHDDGVDLGCNRGLKPWAKHCPKWEEGKRK